MTSAPLAPGFRIGDYELLYELGRGAVGETFAARALAGSRNGRLVCLKVLAQEFRGIRSAKRDVAIRYLQHEARVVSQLEHPNIAKLLDSGTAGDVWYLVFELVEGANLTDVLAEGMLGAYHVMHLGLELSKALACAHERDVLHRDIKPSNILISSGGEVKLVDFGLAKLNAAAASQFSQHVGTPRYFAPEQLRGEALTPATDIYSAGLVLFELLTRSHPFDSPDIDVFRENVLRGLPQRSLRGRNFPADLVAIVETCIQLDSAKRFANGTALANALRAAIDQCSSAGDADLGDLSVHGMADFGPHRAETRLGDVADRVADVRDEPGDFPTRITTDPAEPYRRFAREIALADTAPQDARAAKFETQSIMGDLSRIARAVTEQRSSGIEPAQPHRSGVRPVDDVTPLLSRPRARGARQRPRAHERRRPCSAKRNERERDEGIRSWTRRAGHRGVLVAARRGGCGCRAAAARVRRRRFRRLLRQNRRPGGERRASSRRSSAAEHGRSAPERGKRRNRCRTRDVNPRRQRPRNKRRATRAHCHPSSTMRHPRPEINRSPSARERPRAEASDLVSVTIGTIPYGEVIVDGRRVGPAPVSSSCRPVPIESSGVRRSFAGSRPSS